MAVHLSLIIIHLLYLLFHKMCQFNNLFTRIIIATSWLPALFLEVIGFYFSHYSEVKVKMGDCWGSMIGDCLTLFVELHFKLC